ncbi:hypothetical protein D3C71_1683020 [compost metagenome]
MDSTVTVTTTISVKRSLSLLRGSTAEIASAAEAPQIATAPPESTDCARSRPRRRPRNTPHSRVLTTATITMAAVLQPRPAIWLAVMRAPSRPTPRRSTVRAQNSMPGRVLGSALK